MNDRLNGIGEAPKRVEDVRFLTGSGLYIDDMAPEDVVQAVVLRSLHDCCWSGPRGIVQGIGQALLEQGAYDAGTGQLLSGSFMDYVLPRPDDLPYFDLTF